MIEKNFLKKYLKHAFSFDLKRWYNINKNIFLLDNSNIYQYYDFSLKDIYNILCTNYLDNVDINEVKYYIDDVNDKTKSKDSNIIETKLKDSKTIDTKSKSIPNSYIAL